MNYIFANPLIQDSTILAFDPETRSRIDRRKRSGITVRSLMGLGKRRVVRRQADSAIIFIVDQFSPTLFLPIVAILFLSVFDALLTLFLAAQADQVPQVLVGPQAYQSFLVEVVCGRSEDRLAPGIFDHGLHGTAGAIDHVVGGKIGARQMEIWGFLYPSCLPALC